jgi:glucose-6-phosphate isomerase
MNKVDLWSRYKEFLYIEESSGFMLDVSRIRFDATLFDASKPMFANALAEMAELESGAIANKDENRMVGHYWLRAPEKAPPELRSSITDTVVSIELFAKKIHAGEILSERGERFDKLLLVGIGGSALGPQFVTQALGGDSDKVSIFFLDNTDPDGMHKALGEIGSLTSALCVVISKSGGTKETRNGQLVAKEAWKRAGLKFDRAFVAVTMPGSELDKTAVSEGWLARFPMLDWIGGRTSELSAVGLLPAALQGYDIRGMLDGARKMDELTRNSDLQKNPAGLLALMWHQAGKGQGLKDMVILPYKDRLELFSRYLQQLVMESLGKQEDRNGKRVNQGIAVYGNKGSTDQHAYVQQLRDGVNNFFAVFIEVLKDEAAGTAQWVSGMQVEPRVTCADYLQGFFLGTRSALFENERESLTISVREVSATTVGMLIALFERAVSFYASFVNINAYHQPGVEAGKKAAARVLELQQAAMAQLEGAGAPLSADEVAARIGSADEGETVYKVLLRLAHNGRARISGGWSPSTAKFGRVG